MQQAKIDRITPSAELRHFWSALPFDRPSELWVQGEADVVTQVLSRLPARGLGVVGTRRPGHLSQSLIRQTFSELTGTDLVVISGLASGIDAAVHEAALDQGLTTVAVLGTPIDVTYPDENKPLRNRIIAQRGLVISEHAPQANTLPHHFLQRNRLIAGWSQLVWVVEAPARSGALSTAAWARKYDRALVVTPCRPGDPRMAGNQILLDRDHGQAFWGTHSLGCAWLELATLPTLGRNPSSRAHLSRAERLIRRSTYEQGGVSALSFQDLAAECGIGVERAMLELQSALNRGTVTLHAGWLQFVGSLNQDRNVGTDRS